MYNMVADDKAYAGTNKFYRWGHKAIEAVQRYMTPNEAGYISIPAAGGHNWTIGTSTGKFGEYAKIGETCFSVNRGGYVYAKAGTEKADILLRFMEGMIADMRATATSGHDEEDDD